ncbi:MAG: hypothetical protein M0R28_08285 [Pigmentiphaga sp.]|nr:hypothetical protein [Pigmentiphaga sp.]
MVNDWLGKVRGHVGEAGARFTADARQRVAAEKKSGSTVLTDQMLRSGQWDAGKVLFTTLNGGLTEITASELGAFRRNMQLAKRQAGFDGKGITARQVIDLASSRPLVYAGKQPKDAQSDIDKARREITMAAPVSALNSTIRFMTNAGGSEPGVSRHHVVIELLGFREAVDSITAAGNDQAAPRKAANKLRKSGLKFDCSCKRHRFFLRYVATIGGFNAGRDETGFPKIRNPGLQGVACKHVLRVMTELESSNTALRFLERHLQSATAYKARTTARQAEAEENAKKSPARIKTSEQRKQEADKRREQRGLLSVAKDVILQRPEKALPATRRAAKAAAVSLGKKFVLTPQQIAEIQNILIRK